MDSSTHCRDTPEEWITVKNNRSSRVRTLGMDSSTYHRVMDCCKTQQLITRTHFGHRVKYVTQESQNAQEWHHCTSVLSAWIQAARLRMQPTKLSVSVNTNQIV